jgi:hypothetical protein
MSETTRPPDRAARKPPPDAARIAMPGLYHGPLAGHVAAGNAVLSNGVPVVYLDLGLVAGRHVILAITDAQWLSDLDFNVQLAQSRLSAWAEGHPAAPRAAA